MQAINRLQAREFDLGKESKRLFSPVGARYSSKLRMHTWNAVDGTKLVSRTKGILQKMCRIQFGGIVCCQYEEKGASPEESALRLCFGYFPV